MLINAKMAIQPLNYRLTSFFQSSGVASVVSGLTNLFDHFLSALLAGINGDLSKLKELQTFLDKLLANLAKVPSAPVDTPTIPRTLVGPTRAKRQGIKLLGLEGLIKNVLMLVRQLTNDLLPALQKLLKDVSVREGDKPFLKAKVANRAIFRK